MDVLAALADWPGAQALRGSLVLYPLVNAAHIFAIGLIVGSIVTLDLRLLGFFRAFPVATLGPPLIRVAMTGVVLAIITGFLLFSVRPGEYIQNPAFLTKISLVALGVLNALVLRFGKAWRSALQDNIPSSVRAAAVISIATWAGAVLAGRWIGFLAQ